MPVFSMSMPFGTGTLKFEADGVSADEFAFIANLMINRAAPVEEVAPIEEVAPVEETEDDEALDSRMRQNDEIFRRSEQYPLLAQDLIRKIVELRDETGAVSRESIKESMLPELSAYSPPESRLSNLLQQMAHRTSPNREPILSSFARGDVTSDDGNYYIHNDIMSL